MDSIVRKCFNYCRFSRIIRCARISGSRPKHTMKSEPILYALIGGGIVGLTWIASHYAVSMSFEQVIAYGAVAALLAMAASDYRIRLKSLFR
jgi:hypothetical protein